MHRVLHPIFALSLTLACACGTDTETPGGDTADTSAATDTSTPSDTDAPSVGDAQRGGEVYAQSCGSGYCHGSDGVSGSAPDHPDTIPGLTDAELTDIIQNGTGYMAPVGLSETDLTDVIAYLRATFP